MTSQRRAGSGPEQRPSIDAQPVTEWLVDLDPVTRIAAVETYIDEAKALVGNLYELRRCAVADAAARGVDLPLSVRAISNAVRPDRDLLQSALRLLERRELLRGDPAQLARALGPRSRLDVVANRLLVSMEDLSIDGLPAEARDVIRAAHDRARQILPRR